MGLADEKGPASLARVLIADNRGRVRSALRLVLEQQPGMQIQGEAVDVAGVFDSIRSVCPDILLLDWELPDIRPANLVAELRTRCPGIAIVALSSRLEAAREATDAGADAFVSKGDPPERLLLTVERLRPDRS